MTGSLPCRGLRSIASQNTGDARSVPSEGIARSPSPPTDHDPRPIHDPTIGQETLKPRLSIHTREPRFSIPRQDEMSAREPQAGIEYDTNRRGRRRWSASSPLFARRFALRSRRAVSLRSRRALRFDAACAIIREPTALTRARPALARPLSFIRSDAAPTDPPRTTQLTECKLDGRIAV